MITSASCVFRDGTLLAKELSLPLSTFPTSRDSQIAFKSKQINIISFCETHLHSSEISAIVGPRTAALAAIISKDYEEGVCFLTISN